MKLSAEDFQVLEKGKLHLTESPTRGERLFASKEEYKELMEEQVKGIDKLQRLMNAHDRYALLVIFQGMDASGKDGTIRHVLSGVNPQGCEVTSFKAPSSQELNHDFFWRCYKCLPERGRIGIFNRSYYEEVLILRVHPDLLEQAKLPAELVRPDKIWEQRYESIRDLEKHLYRNGTRILKFFLHISKEEQKKRFLERIDQPAKNWKFSASDVQERRFWDAYQKVYEECLNATSTHYAPWYVVPADEKEQARLIVSHIIKESLQGLTMEYPPSDTLRQNDLQKIRQELEKS